MTNDGYQCSDRQDFATGSGDPGHYGKLQYLIKWFGYIDTDNPWVYKEQIAGSSKLVELFHRLYSKKPCKGKKRKKNQVDAL